MQSLTCASMRRGDQRNIGRSSSPVCFSGRKQDSMIRDNPENYTLDELGAALETWITGIERARRADP